MTPRRIPTWSEWCRMVYHDPNDRTPVLLGFYREAVNIQRGLAR